MRLLETILVPVDFSEVTDAVVRYAGAVASAFHSEIILQTVMPHLVEWGGPSEDLLAMARAGAESRLDDCRKLLESQGVKVRQIQRTEGDPAEEIVRSAEEHDVNVILLGATGRAGRTDRGLGTTADAVRRNSPKPVWLVRPTQSAPPRSILCPVDGSAASERALRNAVHLARRFGARLAVVTVVPPLGGWMASLFGADETAENQWFQRETARLDEFLRRFDFHEVAWERVVRRGDPGERILEVASEAGAELVVVGSSGRGALWRAIAGSVTDKLADQAACSLVTMAGEDAVRVRIDEELADLETHYSRGLELLDHGFPDEARRHFERCVHINDMFVPAWEALAEVHRRAGDDKRREECLATVGRIRDALSWRKVEAEIRASHPLFRKGPSAV